MKNSRRGMLALIILLAVGFAAVTASLVINGTSIFGANDDAFDVIFVKAIVDGEDKSSEVISTDGKSITYVTKELAIKDDESILDFTVKNNSTQYDAEVKVECVGGASVGTYYKIEKSVAEVIPAQNEEDGQVIVIMIKSSTEPIEEQFTCTITANAVERDEAAPIAPSTIACVGICEDQDGNEVVSIGDIITLSDLDASTEQFYVIGYDEDNIQMLSMYNLSVGECGVDGNKKVESCNGWLTGRQASIGEPFEAAFVTFPAYKTIEETVNDYTNDYSNYLANSLGIENTATFITKEDLERIVGIRLGINSNLVALGAPTFLYTTSYHTFDELDDNNSYYIAADGFYGLVDSWYIGVRPVVNISTDLIRDEDPSFLETKITYEDTDNSSSRNIGDIVTISKERASKQQFHIISDDGENLVLMSRYNLYVGSVRTSDFGTTAYTNPTGLQKGSMTGWTSYGIYEGITNFSSSSSKGTNYSDYVGSIVEGYVNTYSSYLSDTLGVENTATLISKEELEEIIGTALSSGDNLSTLGAPAFLYSTSYWTRSALSADNVWGVSSDGDFRDFYINAYGHGVRPIITISSSLVE